MGEVTALTLFFLGLSYGGTACMFTCMPFLSPLLITNSSSYKQSLSLLVPFSMGRVFTYTTIALISSSSAMYIKSVINNPMVSQTILGSATIIVALLIIKSTISSSSSCCVTTPKSISKNSVGYFFMGAGISLNPCVPVMTLITAAAYATSPLQATAYGFVFGMGAIAASFLVFGFILSTMAKETLLQFSKYKKHIQIFAAVVLLIVGIMTLNGQVSL